jgi:hypothetical protein
MIGWRILGSFENILFPKPAAMIRVVNFPVGGILVGCATSKYNEIFRVVKDYLKPTT